jgi:type II secretory pathway pseudopilin PulG
MRRAARKVAKRRQKKKEEKEQKQNARAQERQAREEAGELSPILSESSSDVGLAPPSLEDLGYLFDEEPEEEDDDDEVERRSPKRARTDEGPSAVAGTSRSVGRAWLGSVSGAEAR